MAALPSIEELRETFAYCADTGVLRWKRNVSNVKAGDEAGFAQDVGQRQCLAIGFNGRQFKVHRVIWAIVHGEWPRYSIDHIDGNKLNNRISNLRDVPHEINLRNQKLSRANSSGRTGVRFRKDLQKWLATIRCDGKDIYLGLHESFESACEARRMAERKYGFHENHGRR